MRLLLAVFVVLHPTVFAGTLAGPSRQEAMPNILLVVLDDLGYPDLDISVPPEGTVYLHDTIPEGHVIRTPHLDTFAQQATIFTRAYSGSAVCSPSRASILTGVSPITFGFDRALGSYSYRGLPEGEELAILPELMKRKGYRTIHVGKWHLGFKKDRFLPTSKGYDVALRLAMETKKQSRLFGDDVVDCFSGFTRWWFPDSSPIGQAFLNPCFDLLTHDSDGSLVKEQLAAPRRHSASLLTDWGACLIAHPSVEDARTCVDELAATDDDSIVGPPPEGSPPFFLTLWYWSPHTPATSPPAATDLDDQGNLRVIPRDILPETCIAIDGDPFTTDPDYNARMRYEELVCFLDDVLSRLFAYLETYKSEMGETLVVVTSDNGGARRYREGYGGNGYVAGFKGGRPGKSGGSGGVKEGAVRVPLIVRWIGRAEPGVVNPSPVSLMDILPTISEIAGIDLSPYTIDGISLTSKLSSSRFDERAGLLAWDQAYKRYEQDEGETGHPPWEAGYRERAAVLAAGRKLFTNRLAADGSGEPEMNLYQLYQDAPDSRTSGFEEDTDNKLDDPALASEMLGRYDDWRIEHAEVPVVVDPVLSRTGDGTGGVWNTIFDGDDVVVYEWDDRFDVSGGAMTFQGEFCPDFGAGGVLGAPMIIAQRGAGAQQQSWDLRLIDTGSGAVLRGTGHFEVLASADATDPPVQKTLSVESRLLIESGNCYLVTFGIEMWKRNGDVVLDLVTKRTASLANADHQCVYGALSESGSARVRLASSDQCKAGGDCERVTVGGGIKGNDVHDGFHGRLGKVHLFSASLNERQGEKVYRNDVE